MFTIKQIKSILKKSEILTIKEFEKLEKEAEEEQKNILDYLLEKKIITNALLYEQAANYFKVNFINLKNVNIRKDILFTIPEEIANSHNIIAFDGDDKKIKIATIDPQDLEIIEFLKKKFGRLKLEIYISTPDDIKEVLKLYKKSLKSEFKYLSGEENNEEKNKNKESLINVSKEIPITRIVDTLLEHAIIEGASDIHIEPEEKDVLVRYRIDGILHNVMTLPKNIQPGLISRIKILSNLKVDEHRLPQDGRFKIKSETYKVSFRVSIIPTFDGEKIVMRLLNEKSQTLTLEQLGFQNKPFDIVKKNIEKPHGIILVTGPTGSGKTTTLYTILNILNTPKVNISTIEDPIEYRMKCVNQSQVNSKIGFTFASGLRSLLRQDPDIIMVGEIRDQETAEIAIHSAMTGHLVLSTIHTNDAVSTIPRLTEMGVPAFLISSTLNLIIAQRLVRRICPDCIQSYNLDEKMINELKKHFDINKILETLEREKIISNKKNGLKELLFYRGKGCNKCRNTGYKSRIGIYEVLENESKLSNLISQNLSTEKIKEYTLSKNMLTMIEDGFIKAKNGITTIEEILRVTKE
ncbi:MAG: GspE/PulE family protein [Patescibacteria group bacterium]|nr:GspE/PulE family protein [Patescibacteria group bacterium]MDD4304802.1 GspE/PulE family protein [Patescibacteria group bacterium]MDD4695854.1 GspE/PulE family protein [Patescibacteria group bacterium]